MLPRPTETRRILLAALGLAILRAPILLTHGRVMAEEGPVYFAPAWNGNALSAFLAPHMGYYSLFLNSLTVFSAHFLPVEWLGLALTSASLAVLLLTVYLAVTCEAFADSRSRWIAAGIVMLTPAIEVWLTAEDAQFYLPVCAALICISSENRHRFLRTGTLCVAALTGPTSAVVTPFFLWRAFRRRTGMAILQAAVVTIGTLVEAILLLRFLHAGARPLSSAAKDAWFGPVLVLKIFSVSVFGRPGAFLAQRIVLAHTTPAICVVFWIPALLLLALFWRMARHGGSAGMTIFAIAMASLVFDNAGTIGSLQTILIGAFRYYFTGFVLLWMLPVLALAGSKHDKSSGGRKLPLALCCLFLFWGAVDSIGYWSRLQNVVPDWQDQVAAWRKDPHTPIMVAPPGWKTPMYLQPHHH